MSIQPGFEANLAATLHQMQARQFSMSLYLDKMCRHLDTVNGKLHAFLPEEGRLERLRRESTTARLAGTGTSSPPRLYGALLGVKDIFHVDGYTTHCGSDVPAELFAGDEATCVRLVRAAGALVIGKTVTTEFAYAEPGPTRNPHNLGHTPGGSSSGSAAAVAAGMCTLALGTQTIGSVIRPASFCGIVGFKPSLDRIATDGIVYFSRTVDHVGLFTQDIAGMQIAASVVCANWDDGEQSARLPVLGVPDGPYLEQTEPAALAAFEEQVLMLQVAGYEVKRIEAFADIESLNALHRRLIFGEFAREHERAFSEYMSMYRPRTAEAIQIGQGVGEGELEKARGHCALLRDRLQSQMTDSNFDVWICPSATGPAPAGIDFTGDPNMNLPWTHAGLPTVSIPAGRSPTRLPLGVQVVAQFGCDEQLLHWSDRISTCLSIIEDEPA